MEILQPIKFSWDPILNHSLVSVSRNCSKVNVKSSQLQDFSSNPLWIRLNVTVEQNKMATYYLKLIITAKPNEDAKKSDSDAITAAYDVTHALPDFNQIWSTLEPGYL